MEQVVHVIICANKPVYYSQAGMFDIVELDYENCHGTSS